MRILIIGGTRFIGPPVVRRLHALGHEVILFHRGATQADLPMNIEHIQGDRNHLADFKNRFSKLAPEIVIDMIPFFEIHARLVMEVFQGIAGRILGISSMDVYRVYDVIHGHETLLQPIPLTESSPLRERLYPYRGKQKTLEEYDKILVERVMLGNPVLPGTILRLPMVYGPGDPQHRIHGYLKRMDDQRPAILLDQGFATWRGPRGYVDDVAQAIVLAATHNRAIGQVYHVAAAKPETEAAWIGRVARAAGWHGRILEIPSDRLPIHLSPGFNTLQHWTADSSKIRSELGYQEELSQEEAMQRTVAWARAHPPAEIDAAAFDYAAEDKLLSMEQVG